MKKEELKVVINNHIKNYLDEVAQDWYNEIRYYDGASRIKYYQDIRDIIFEDIIDMYDIEESLSDKEIYEVIDTSLKEVEHGDFENQTDLKIFIIR